jgi:hypothetical protein
MGRAFRVVKRTAHLTVRVSERPLKIARVAAVDDAAGAKPARARKTAGGAAAGAKKTTSRGSRKTAAAKA